jgi:catechol 2,3-dioxygenase-like lactoylglutathione lyase family enzyme
MWALCVANGVFLLAAQAGPPQPAAPHFVQDSLNVFRRFTGDGHKTLEFYGEVLGAGELKAVAVGRGQVSRFQVGTSQLKFTRAADTAHFTRGAIADAVGVRLWTIWFPDEAALAARFTAHGYAAPSFKTVDGIRSALVTDPDGEWVQLVVEPHAPAGTYDRLEVGIASADLEKSRAFYRQFVGLEELPPVRDPVLGVTKYPFRHGTTTISVWAAPGPRPANPGMAGIQYVVDNVDAVDARARERSVPVEQPLADTLPGLRTVWLFDPDQVTNYFAQIGRRNRSQESGIRNQLNP